MNHIQSNGEIVIKEWHGSTVIRHDAANLGRSEENGLWTSFSHPPLDLFLARQVEIFALHSEKGAVLLLKAAKQRRSHHAPVAGYPYALTSEAIERFRYSHNVFRLTSSNPAKNDKLL
jgi:hypothetical protein